MGWLAACAIAATALGALPTDNFTVYDARPDQAAATAEACEHWRTNLFRHWRGAEPVADWAPKCDIVVHATRQSYAAAVGGGGGRSFGSSLVQLQAGRVAGRRIDLLRNEAGELSALPHELTHVILADLCQGKQPPRWLDEGLAVLADPREKQSGHRRDLESALASGRAFRVGELLALDRYPAADRIPAFYAQSASLAALLAQRDEPARLIEFLAAAQEHGYDAALRQVYRLDGVAALERLWHERRQTAETYASLHVGYDRLARFPRAE